MKEECTKNVKTEWKKKRKVTGFFSDIKIFSKPRVNHIIYYSQRDQQMNRTENPETDLHIHDILICDGADVDHWLNNSLFN